MVRRNALIWTLATLALLGARTVMADPITFTGNVATDFNPATNSGVQVIQGDPDPLNRIYQLPQMTAAGIINGYAIKDMRLDYDSKSDTLYVGLNTYSIAGTAVGNGGAAMDALLQKAGGQDPAHIGGQKSITVGFAGLNLNNLSTPGSLVAVAGVPADKSIGGTGIDGFTVAAAKAGAPSLESAYGTILKNNMGNLAFDPSAAHPNFEFTIKNFSKISSQLDPTKGFWVQAYAGSPNDNPIGEEGIGFVHVPAFAPQNIPEPTTWLAWSLVAGAAAAVRLRRRAS